MKLLISLLLIVPIAVTQVACGKKGDPLPPAEADNIFPRKYPK